ncbi:uncharacterized protein (DUF3084 family) [Anaerospora hongkongensis]|uniref:Uncharacterized protein (DUF3084 family) n=1 Tax=Anaerospora hongkongensis TaxID=244830 RepID=A0A4R1PXD0_9FIRM|nr:DUF3084 domain-containing protein [Anaerospora hongkongensis]TCL32927.1 uncharacterized protein (DUF3084 family) [Anaerospora hongkongensis]
MYGLALIAVLAVMGGAIAYIGDKLGTKVGKKKLSMFGLRPKHTSIIVTIVTGILIAASTLGILSLTSRDVRTALFGMEALKNNLARLSQEVAVKNNELETSRAALQAKIAEFSTLDVRVKESAKQLAEITDELSQVTDERDRTIAALSKVQADYTTAKGDLTKATKEISALQTTKAELDKRVASLNEAKVSLQSDVDRLNELAVNLKKGIEVVREGVVIFRAGEVLSTNVVQGGLSQEQTEQALSQIIYGTNRSITDKLGVQSDLEVLWVSKNDYQQAASLISSTPGSIIVRITAAGNTIYGEPTISRIDLFPNKLVYDAGAVVYSEVFDAGKNNQHAEEAVLLFLQKVNTEAIKEGILPDPIQGTVGAMSGSQLFETINKVKRFNGKVEIAAVTTDDIHTAGPLKITIRVKAVQ